MTTHTAERALAPQDTLQTNDASLHISPAPACDVDREVMKLLSQRYGDGLVYLHEPAQHPHYERAVHLGLVSADGYLTAAGQSLINRHCWY